MPQESETDKLKLIHLVWIMTAMAIAVGVAWGVTTNQQKTNTGEIEKKVDNKVFMLHLDQQKAQSEKVDKKLDKIIEIMIDEK